MSETLSHFINGARTAGTSGRTLAVENPATGEVERHAPMANAGEVDAAVQAAARAFPAWSVTPPAKRAQVMFKFREKIHAHMDEITELVSREHGKTLADARGSLMRGLEVLEFTCGIQQFLKGEISPNVASGIDVSDVRQPLGVCAGITPFNFPEMIPLWMFPMAIACGNTFVLKPSEQDPSAPLRLAELMQESGLPEGVLNVVNGDREAVDSILDHPRIEGVSFVGSTKVAQVVRQRGTANGKRVQAFGGAKNHMVVMPDADMDQAADALLGAGYGAAGERCMAVSVAVPVGEKTGDALIERLAPRVRNLRIGPYTDTEADMGPLISDAAKERVEGYVETGIQEGAEAVVDGRGVTLQGYENGHFLGGTLFDRVTTDMRIYQEEIFGPVLSVVRAESPEQALKITNDHHYGNGAAIFTRDGDTARAFADEVNYGMVGVNVPIPVPPAHHSFGGWKQSIFAEHDIYGAEAVRFYTKHKTITSRWPSGIGAGAGFSFKGSSEE